MSAQSKNVTIGAFVLGGIALVVVAVALLGSGRLFRKTYAFVSYFDGSVNGLRTGAAVKFKGVEIGKVDKIRIPFRVDHVDQPIEVFYSLESDVVESARSLLGGQGDGMSGAIEKGLRAQLQTDSLLTGVQHVSLTFTEERAPVLHEPIDGAIEIPTVATPLQGLETSVRMLIDKIGRTDFDRLFASLNKTLDAIGDFASGSELKAALTSLDDTLRAVEAAAHTVEGTGEGMKGGAAAVTSAAESFERLTEDVRTGVDPLLASLKTSSDRIQSLALELEKALATSRVLLDPEAPIAVELRATLRELSETAHSTRALFDYLERNPSALVRGRETEAK